VTPRSRILMSIPCSSAWSEMNVEVRVGLVRGETQVGGPDLDQLAAHPPPSQRQIRVGAGTYHHVHLGWKVLQEEGQTLVDLVIVNQVVIVEHQPHLNRRGGQLVEQRGKHQLGRHRGGREQLQRTVPTPGTAPWTAVTTYVQNDAGWLSAASSESHARQRPSADASYNHAARTVVLPNPARGGHQRQPRFSSVFQPLEESGSCHQTASQLRDVDFVAINGCVTPSSFGGTLHSPIPPRLRGSSNVIGIAVVRAPNLGPSGPNPRDWPSRDAAR
jgi:hypothetical protein